MQPHWEVSDVLRKVNLPNQNFTVHKEKTLRALTLCRTAALSGHVDACDACAELGISVNSWRKRQCPKCQGHQRDEWIPACEQDLLPCSYYHLVFTLPDILNGLAISHPTIIYKILFDSVCTTLNQSGTTEG